MTPDTITLKANSIYPVRVVGKYLSILSCTAALAVELDNGGRVNAVAGSQFGNGEGFSKISFVETSGVDNVISYTVSDFPSPGRAQVVQSAAETFVGPKSGQYDFGSVVSPGGVTFPGTDSQGRARKLIYITNSGRTTVGGVTTNAVLAVSAGGGWGLLVQSGVTQPIETSADIIITAGTNDLSTFANHLIGSVLEIFNSKPLQADQ